MKNGNTSKRQFWNDVKLNEIRSKDEYEFTTSDTNYFETKEILTFLNEHSKSGVESVSPIISRWEVETIHTILHGLCRYDIHPDHWMDLIDEYQSRPNKSSLKPPDFLKQKQHLWGERAAIPRNRKKSLSNEQLREQNKMLSSQVKQREEELDEFVEMFDEELKEKRDQLEAEVNEINGIEFEKELMMKDKNGKPDDLGWYKLDEYRRVKDQLFNHFQKDSSPQEKISIKDKIKALSKS